MGLDMYLSARQTAFKNWKNPKLYNRLVQEAPFALDFANVEVQVAYWRKSNQVATDSIISIWVRYHIK